MATASIIAAVTESGKTAIAEMLIGGKGFLITSFVVGSGGADPGDPTVPLSPDPTQTSLPGQTFGPKLLVQTNPPYTGIMVTPFCPQFQAMLDLTEANGPISNYGLVGQYSSSPIPNDPLVGTQFLFAIGNTGTKTKSDADQFQIFLTLQTS